MRLVRRITNDLSPLEDYEVNETHDSFFCNKCSTRYLFIHIWVPISTLFFISLFYTSIYLFKVLVNPIFLWLLGIMYIVSLAKVVYQLIYIARIVDIVILLLLNIYSAFALFDGYQPPISLDSNNFDNQAPIFIFGATCLISIYLFLIFLSKIEGVLGQLAILLNRKRLKMDRESNIALNTEQLKNKLIIKK